MTDEELKQLIASNAKSIQAISLSRPRKIQEREKAYREWEKDRNQLYKYLGRIDAAQSNFYKVQANYYEQLALLSERQAKSEETQVKMQAQVLQILKRLGRLPLDEEAR
jgi:hypothetical protein